MANKCPLKHYGFNMCSHVSTNLKPAPSTANRVQLTKLRDQNSNKAVTAATPDRNTTKKVVRRKRGKRGGRDLKVRQRGDRPFVPRVVMGNVRSLINKIDTLRLFVSTVPAYMHSHMIAITESWTHCGVPDHFIGSQLGFRQNQRRGRIALRKTIVV